MIWNETHLGIVGSNVTEPIILKNRPHHMMSDWYHASPQMGIPWNRHIFHTGSTHCSFLVLGIVQRCFLICREQKIRSLLQYSAQICNEVKGSFMDRGAAPLKMKMSLMLRTQLSLLYFHTSAASVAKRSRCSKINDSPNIPDKNTLVKFEKGQQHNTLSSN